MLTIEGAGARMLKGLPEAVSPPARTAAEDLAASFLAEMLSFAGFDDAFSSGAGFGGEAMSGFLMREYADKIVERGGLGIADMIAERLAHAEIADGSK